MQHCLVGFPSNDGLTYSVISFKKTYPRAIMLCIKSGLKIKAVYNTILSQKLEIYSIKGYFNVI
jgi:hypothetical protein